MNTLKKALRIISIALLSLIILIFITSLFTMGLVNRTPVQQLPIYSQMMKRLDSLDTINIPVPATGIKVGFSKVSITPSQKTSLAGYGNRRGKLFSSVHDSIFVRSVFFDNGASRAVIVNAELLIIPPKVTERLNTQLSSLGLLPGQVYLTATHSHNSIGNWGEGATSIIYGEYQDSVVSFITDRILQSILIASQNLAECKIKAGSININEAVKNRLVDDGPEDPFLRLVEIERSDSSKLLLMNFAAHSTCLYSRDLELSGDYPGALVRKMESDGYDFAMFMSGAVGSHAVQAPKAGWECLDWMTQTISTKIAESRSQLLEASDSTIVAMRVPLPLADPQVKITRDLKVRSWVFRSLFGEYPAYLSVLRIGEIVMLGTPCDYSGEFVAEIESTSNPRSSLTMVTSFNGGYIGYVTPVKYFDEDHYETQLMNWYPPGNGEYIQRCLQRLNQITTN